MSDVKYTQDRSHGYIYRIIGEMSPETYSSRLLESLNVTADQRLPSSESKAHSRIFYSRIKKAFGEEFVNLRAIYCLSVKHMPLSVHQLEQLGRSDHRIPCIFKYMASFGYEISSTSSWVTRCGKPRGTMGRHCITSLQSALI